MVNKEKINLPLVNTHTHAAMVGFRGLAEDMPLNKWLEEHIWPAEREQVNPRFVYEKTKEAISEMKKNGIAVFSDMYFFESEVARAAEEMQMPVVIGEAILDFPTPSAKTPEEAFSITENLLEKYKNHPYIKVAVAPHSIYAVSKENLLKARDLAKKYDTLLHIHLSETKFEFDECLKKNKKTPVEYLESLGLLDEKTIAAHCVWLTDEDIDILANKKVSVAHCPLSNLKLGSGIAPISKMIAKGINVTLGTDGAASSNRLDIWEAGKYAALLQKGITNDPSVLSAREAIEMMTVNGLKALGMGHIIEKDIAEFKNYLGQDNDLASLYSLNVEEISGY